MTDQAALRFAKGHGTGNDFVVLPDPDGRLELDDRLVRALCDRRHGIGADGLLRVVATRHVPGAAAGDGTWFMDYRNADGSVAEMCGNGLRVFGRYLVRAGLARPGRWSVATRAGPRLVEVDADPAADVAVGMGAPVVTGRSVAVVGGRRLAGVAVSVGNPHLVCLTEVPVSDLDLSGPPVIDTVRVPAPDAVHVDFPDGVNVEVVNVLPSTPDGMPAARMRVHERGVGETRSCGTGAVAVAVAVLRQAGRAEGVVGVHVPGGRLSVRVVPGDSVLVGPAVLVADGVVDAAWLAARRAAAPAVR